MTSKTHDQINYAAVRVGDWLRMKPAREDGMFESANPTSDKGAPMQVKGAHKVLGEGQKWFEFAGAKRSVARAGTAFVYRYQLDAKGKPLPDATYPVCPRCKADEDDPSCHGPSGPVGKWHAAREKLRGKPVAKRSQLSGPVSTPPTGIPYTELIYPDGKNTPAERVDADQLQVGDCVHGTTPSKGSRDVLPWGDRKWAKGCQVYKVYGFVRSGVGLNLDLGDGLVGVGMPNTPWSRIVEPLNEGPACEECGHMAGSHYLPEHVREDKRACRVFTCGCTTIRKPERKPDTIDATFVAIDAGAKDPRVLKRADGSVHILGWDKGELTATTPEGWNVHVDEAGEVTVLGTTKRLPPTDADDVARGPIGRMKGSVSDPERRALDVDEDNLPEYDESDPVGQADGVKCTPCKGFGLVRGKGSNAGRHYRTFEGAQQAQANGNAADCPACQGEGLVAA